MSTGSSSGSIVLIGYGTVGRGVVEILRRRRQANRLLAVVARNPLKERPAEAPPLVFSAQEALEQNLPDIVIEATGSLEAARGWILWQLRRGKTVITANKAVVARWLAEFEDAEARYGGTLLYEASCGGALPLLRTLSHYYSGEQILSVEGVVNGTTNAILSSLESGLSFAAALAEAQRRGLAEADPTADLSGADAAAKLALLARHALGFRIPVPAIETTGIQDVAEEDVLAAKALGGVIRVIASASRVEGGGIQARVAPVFLPRTHFFGSIRGEQNAVAIHGSDAGTSYIVGVGAGALPTASAVIADLEAADRGERYLLRAAATGPLRLPADALWYVRYKTSARGIFVRGSRPQAENAVVIGVHGDLESRLISREKGAYLSA